MSLFKREPRTVYRVYGEDEYFGHEQPAEDGGLEVMPAVEDIGAVEGDDSPMVERARSEEEPPLPYRGPARDLRPLAVGLLAAAVIGVLALVAIATLGRSVSRAPQATAVAAPAPGSAEARGGGATRSGEKLGAEWALHARSRARARVTMATRPTTAASRIGRSRAGRSRTGSSQARAHRPPFEAGRASVSFAGAQPAAVATVPAGLAGAGGEAYAATPASQATAEFGFER